MYIVYICYHLILSNIVCTMHFHIHLFLMSDVLQDLNTL